MANLQPVSSVEKKQAEVKRVCLLVAPAIAGPVASVWASALHHNPGKQRRRVSSGQSEELGPSHRRIKFTTSHTEDAMDSVIPCAAEEFFRPMMQSKFGNPARLNFRYTSQQQ